MPSLRTPSTRWLALASLALLVAAVASGTLWLRARSEARHEAEIARARTVLDTALGRTMRAIEEPADQTAARLGELRGALEAQLTARDRPPGDLREQRSRLQDQLGTLADRLDEAARAPLPQAPDVLEDVDPEVLLGSAEAAQQRAGGLAGEIRRVTTATQEWATTLADLRANAQAFVDVAASQAPTSNPSRLISQWEAERAPLQAYRAAAEHARNFAGLAPIAEAHLHYASANLAWIDEAVQLLREDRLDAYNRRLREVFGDDPFGFRAALTEATEQALRSGVLAELDQASADATGLARLASQVEADASRELSPEDDEARTARAR